MKKILLLICTALAILSPFIITYWDKTPGLEDTPFINILAYAIIVIGIVGIVTFILRKFSFFPKGYYFLLCDLNDYQICNEIIKELETKKWKVLPPSIDFFITNVKGKDKLIEDYLKLATGVVIVIGNDSATSDYFNYMIKFIKKRGLKVTSFKTSSDVEIPPVLQRSIIMPIATIENKQEIASIIEFFLQNTSKRGKIKHKLS